jgi:hypothetical protein
MSQFWTVLFGAILVGVIALVVGTGYVSASSSKLPEQPEMIQLFVSGSLVGAFISWLLSSSYLHGSSFMGMLSSDFKSTLKDLGLKGGDETAAVVAAAAAAPAVAPAASPAATAAVTQMVGGFFKSMGMGDALQEMSVGLPSF